MIEQLLEVQTALQQILDDGAHPLPGDTRLKLSLALSRIDWVMLGLLTGGSGGETS